VVFMLMFPFVARAGPHEVVVIELAAAHVFDPHDLSPLFDCHQVPNGRLILRRRVRLLVDAGPSRPVRPRASFGQIDAEEAA
jgi:hypothetical protein